jgi:hypothetical protein
MLGIDDSGRRMKREVSIVIGGLVLLLASTSTISAQGKLSRTRARVAAPAVGGAWNVMVSLNVANDTPIVTAALRADAPVKGWLQTAIPTLVVRCQTPPPRDETVLLSTKGLPVLAGLDVYIDTGMPASADQRAGTHMISVRFDAGPVEHWGTIESTDTEALFVAPFYARQMIGKLTHSRRLLVEFTPLNAPPATISFDTNGFKTHAAQVLAACPTVDRTRGRYPLGVEPLGGPSEPLIGRYTGTIQTGLTALKVGRRSKRSAIPLRAARLRHVRRRAASRA